jgi:lipopolysaccharide export LptBFGC system permease protein LptF
MTQGTVEERLQRLEKEVRTWRRVGVGALLVAGATFLMAAKPAPQVSEELRARKFTLVDEAGEVRGGMGVIPAGNDFLSGATTLGLTNGKSRVMLVVMKDQSELRMFRDDAKNTVHLRSGDKPTLMMIDGQRKRALTLGVSDKGVLDISSLETGKPQPLWGEAH